jgi:hypothetical protein
VVKNSERIDYSIRAAASSTIQSASGFWRVGEQLSYTVPTYTTKDGTLDSPVLTQQWYRSGKAISGATAPTYTLTSSDYAKKITVKVTVKAPGGQYLPYVKTTASTPTITRGVFAGSHVAPTVTFTPETNTLKVTLTAGSITTPSPSLSYIWYRNGVAIKNATSSSYKPTSSDTGKTISVKVTVKKTNYNTLVLPTAVVPN